MGLKKIRPKHREIMRRMIMCQDPEEISLDLRVSREYLGMLSRDDLFADELNKMEAEVHSAWVAKRKNAMDILEDGAANAARLCVDAVDGIVDRIDEDGQVGVEIVPLGQRLNSAWDVLNRTGNKAIEKKIVAHASLQDMIIEAYRQRQDESAQDIKAIDG